MAAASISQHGKPVGHQRGPFQRLVPGEGADPQSVAVLGDEIELREPVDVDQDGRAQQPEIEHRDEALSPSQDLCLAAGSRERAGRLFEARRPHVSERRRLHRDALRGSPACRSRGGGLFSMIPGTARTP
jgi:hypothetical protein